MLRKCRLTGYLGLVHAWYLNRPAAFALDSLPCPTRLEEEVCDPRSVAVDYGYTFGKGQMHSGRWEMKGTKVAVGEGDELVEHLSEQK